MTRITQGTHQLSCDPLSIFDEPPAGLATPLAGERSSQPKLSAAEARERRRVYQPSSGVGFRHGSAQVDRQQARRWFASLSPAQRRVLGDGKAAITIVGNASGTGGKAINKKLATERAENLGLFLKDALGVKCAIRVRPRPTARTGRDDATLRTAVVRFDVAFDEPRRGSAPSRPPSVADRLRAAGQQSQRLKTAARDKANRGTAADGIVATTLSRFPLLDAFHTFAMGLSAIGKASITAQQYGKNLNLSLGWASVLEHGLAHPKASAAELARGHGNRGKPPLLPAGSSAKHVAEQQELRRAYETGVAMASKLLSTLSAAAKVKLSTAIDKQAHGSTRLERVRHFGQWLTGSRTSRNPLTYTQAQLALSGQKAL